jgi:hypothetical protein
MTLIRKPITEVTETSLPSAAVVGVARRLNRGLRRRLESMQKVWGSAGLNRYVAGDERALQERRERLHPDPESCRFRREAWLEA